MSGTESKSNAREAVKKVFEKLKNNVTETNSASEILDIFTKELVTKMKTLKKERKKETILGKYLKGYDITGADKSPISRAVEGFLSNGAVFRNKAFVDSDNKVNEVISDIQGDVAKKLGKCKRLKSADVLAAMYHVSDKGEINSVLRLLTLGEMFTELGKANGFIKGNSAGVAENDPIKEDTEEKLDDETDNNRKNEEKDNKNKHLGTLATKDIRNLAATIGAKIKKLFKDAEWLKKEQTTTENYTEAPTGKTIQNEIKDQPKDDRTKAIEMQQEYNIRKKYLKKNGENAKVLSEDLKPRDEDTGKYRTREMATDEQMTKFLGNAGNAFHIRELKKCVGDEQSFKDALDKKFTIDRTEVTMRKILNKIADIVYKGNSIIEVVEKLPGTAEDLDSLLTLVEAKLKRSHDKNEDRVKLNKALKDWITVINVVNACAETFEVVYDSGKTYDDMLKGVVGELKSIEIKVVAEDGGKLEDKTIENIEEINLNETKFPELSSEHKKRLKSLKIGYDEKNLSQYVEMYEKIYTFINIPSEENLKNSEIAKKYDSDKITKNNWDKSKTFDEFAANDGKDISGIVVKKNETVELPPLNGESRDKRLVLSNNENAYDKFDASKEWFEKPSMEDCSKAVKELTVNEYLGTNINLLKALKGEEEYVLAIKLDSFVKSWTDLALSKLGGEKLGENNCRKDTDGAQSITLKDGMSVCATLSEGEEGYTLKQVNSFITFVSGNINSQFCEVDGIKDESAWGNLMTGKWAFLIKKDDSDDEGVKGKIVGLKGNGNRFEYVCEEKEIKIEEIDEEHND